MDNTVRIGDFGLVSAFGEEKPSKKKERIEKCFHRDSISFTSDAGGNDEVGGTVLYMSPEQINHQPYNQKVDIYAMGIILFELLYPFSTQMERMRAINDVRLKEPIFPLDFERNENESTQFIVRFVFVFVFTLNSLFFVSVSNDPMVTQLFTSRSTKSR